MFPLYVFIKVSLQRQQLMTYNESNDAVPGIALITGKTC